MKPHSVLAAIIAPAALALLAAACSGSPSSAGSGGSSNAGGSVTSRLLAYSGCMRAHGVPNFPDPDSGGEFDKATLSQLAASNSQYQAASSTCGHLLPPSTSGHTQSEVQQEWTGMLNFARCMHSHGQPDWPDPTHYPPDPTQPTFQLPASIQPVPQVISEIDVCRRLVPDSGVVGHIDNNNWTSAQQAMAGQ
jgi:hypothetical protein